MAEVIAGMTMSRRIRRGSERQLLEAGDKGDLARIQLETVDVAQIGPRTSLRFRLKK